MDLRLRGIPPSAAERAAVDAVLGPPKTSWGGDGRHALQASCGGEALRAKRHLLLPVLHAVQDRCGWISPEALDYLCQRLAIPPAEAYGVASFYALLSVSPQPPVVAHVCDDLACLMQGAEALCADVSAPSVPLASPSLRLRRPGTVARVLCDRAPAVLLRVAGASPDDQTMAPATAMQVCAACQSHGVVPMASSPVPQVGAPDLHLLRRVGVVDPASLDAYARMAGTLPCVARWTLDPRACSARSTSRSSWGAAARRFRPDASGRLWRRPLSIRTT